MSLQLTSHLQHPVEMTLQTSSEGNDFETSSEENDFETSSEGNDFETSSNSRRPNGKHSINVDTVREEKIKQS